MELKQGGEPSSGMMDYVDPLRALEAMGARDIKVGRRGEGRGGADGLNTRERCIALPCPGLLPCSNLVIGGKAESVTRRGVKYCYCSGEWS